MKMHRQPSPFPFPLSKKPRTDLDLGFESFACTNSGQPLQMPEEKERKTMMTTTEEVDEPLHLISSRGEFPEKLSDRGSRNGETEVNEEGFGYGDVLALKTAAEDGELCLSGDGNFPVKISADSNGCRTESKEEQFFAHGEVLAVKISEENNGEKEEEEGGGGGLGDGEVLTRVPEAENDEKEEEDREVPAMVSECNNGGKEERDEREVCEKESKENNGGNEEEEVLLGEREALAMEFKDKNGQKEEEEVKEGGFGDADVPAEDSVDSNGKEVEEEGDIKMDEGFYLVESIQRKRVWKGQLQYLVKWQGWPASASTWEPVDNLKICEDMIAEFNKRGHENRKGRKHRRGKRKYQLNPVNQKKSCSSSAPCNREASSNVEVGEVSEDVSMAPEVPDGRGPEEPIFKHFNVGKKGTKTEQVPLESKELMEMFSDNTYQDIFSEDVVNVSNSSSGLPTLPFSGLPSNGTLDSICEIIKAISFTKKKTNRKKNAIVTFKALRSNGEEVVVDNLFLKAKYPELLLDFYEQRLQYNS